MTRTLISFATSEYAARQQALAHSAARWFDRIVNLGPNDIDAEFRQANAKLFESRRGYGYWIWKPYLILRHLEQLADGDALFYADSQCVFESDPAPLFDLASRHDGIGLFHQRREGHRNSTWTRGDAFRLMDCDEPKYWSGDNLATTFSVWSKTDRSLAFVREWLRWACEYAVVSDEPSVTTNAPDFKDHRHDQSIASLLAIKHGLFTLCDCSQWGDGYRCPECRYPRILRTDRRVIAPWLARPTMSSIIEVSTVGACPLRCSFCPQDALAKAYEGPKHLTLELFGRCLDNLTPGDAIYFCGFVEPCINPAIVPMIEMTLARGHRCRLYTTGRGLDVAAAEQIAAMPLEQIVLHLPDNKGFLNHAPSNADVLRALARHPHAKVMAMAEPGARPAPHPDVIDVWRSLNEQASPMRDRAGNLARDNMVPLTHKGAIKCGVAPSLDHSVLLPSGELAVCCMSYDLNPIIGNLAKTPYADILRGPVLNKLREQQQNGEDCICRHCDCAVPAGAA